MLPEARGFGSCLLVLPEALLDSWQFEKRSDKYCVWFDEKGKRYKSSKEGTCVISFDLNGNRYEIGQVKHRSTAHKYKLRLSAVQNSSYE